MVGKNNPFNIRSSRNKWLGQIGSRKGFCEFSSLGYGIRAVLVLMCTYRDKYHLKTVRDVVTRFAPPSENKTEDYIKYVDPVGCGSSLFYRNPYHYLAMMSQFEGNKVPYDLITWCARSYDIDVWHD